MTNTYSNEPKLTIVARPYVQWPSIVAGAFVALALFVLSVLLARACDVDITFHNAAHAGGEAGAIIWGGIAALICFGIGGFVAARNAALAGAGHGFINGLMVWAVVVPLLVYFLGTGIGPRLGQSEEFGGGKALPPEAAAMQASARIAPNGENNANSAMPETTGSPTYISHPQAAAWWMLVSLGLGLVGSAVTGAVSGGTRKQLT